MEPEEWHFRKRSAVTLERVVPISLRKEVEDEFTVALTSMEIYGNAGCIVRYLLDIYSMNIAENIGFGPENFRGDYLWSDTIHIFVVRDQTGREYEVSLGGGDGSADYECEYYEGSLEIEPLSPKAENLTVELKEIVRETCYRDQPELASTGDEERFIERLWSGSLSFTFAVEQECSATIEGRSGPGEQAAMLERVIPVSQRFESERLFVVALISLEDYGESGCTFRYALDLSRPDLESLQMTGPETGQPVHFSNVEPEFEVRDQSGHVYGPAIWSGSYSLHEPDNTELRHAHVGFESLRLEAESLTIDLTRLVRTTRYDDHFSEHPSDSEAEEITETIWEGPRSFTFAV